MTISDYKTEIKILMPFFKMPISELNNLIKIHGSAEKAWQHLATMFDDRKAMKN